jgi:hypothetical protein
MPPGRRPTNEQGIEERRAQQMQDDARMRALLAYAQSQGLTLGGPINPANIPQMTEAAGPIPKKPDAGFWDNVKGIGSQFLAFVPGTQQSEDMAAALQNDPTIILKGPVQSVSNVVDLLPYVDTGEKGVNYANAYNRGEGLGMIVNDALTLYALGKAGANVAKPVVQEYITNPGARFNPYDYGIHVNVPGETGITKIVPRQPGQATVTGGDSVPGYTYMWDATQPGIVENIMSNPQMTNTGMFDVLYDNPPAAYLTRAGKYRTGTDINVPSSPSLAVRGAQKVIEEVPLTQQALQDLLVRRRVMQMTEDAGLRKILANSARAGVPNAIGDNNAIMAYNNIRDRIIRAQGNPDNPLSQFSPNITIEEMYNNPILRPDMEAIAARRIMAQEYSPDLIRDRILAPYPDGAGFTEGQYRAIVAEAQRLNDAGIPMSQAMRQVLDDSVARRAAGETLPEVVRDSGMASIPDPRANQRLQQITDEQILMLIEQNGTIEARKLLGSPDYRLWQQRLSDIQAGGAKIPGMADDARASFAAMPDEELARMIEGRNLEKVRKQLNIPSQEFYARLKMLKEKDM